jgi:hypothetical protein
MATGLEKIVFNRKGFSLSTNSELLKIMEVPRKESRAGKSGSLEEPEKSH